MTGDGTAGIQAYQQAPFLRPLAALSAALGRDLTQVQGPGGNTSLKHEDILWVKASGTELAEAETRCIFVPVGLKNAREAVLGDDERPIVPLDVPYAQGLRPSIECSLHALMPHRVVVHTHDVDVIARAICEDAEQALAPLMAGFDWAFIPYARPGLPLTRAVRAVLSTRSPDILILGNHGLVLGGRTPEEVTERLARVRQRLQCPARPTGKARLEALTDLCNGTRFAPAALPQAHGTALDETACRVAAGGVLYPDHVVFLGAETAIIPPHGRDRLQQVEARFVLVPGAGVLIENGQTDAAEAMAACLGLVTCRFAEGARPAYLGAEDISELLGWDAERYRQELARRKAVAMQG